jgi:hypothetical protein
MTRRRPSGILLGLALAAGCGRSAESPGRERPAAGGALGVSFVDRWQEAGIRFHHTDGSSGKHYIVETLASGVLLLDFDEDADLDIYFVNGRPLPPSPQGNAAAQNALYRQDAAGKFTDVTVEKAIPGTGFGSGGAAGDYDGDGDLDVYVCQYGPNALYRQNGKEAGYTFTEVIKEAGCDDPRFSAGASFFDMDRDGDLDLYVTNYCQEDFKSEVPCKEGKVYRYCAPNYYQPQGDSLFRNLGNGKFEDLTASSGIAAVPPGRGMGIVATDFNRDGWIDIYVANDGSENFLLKNLGNGKFADVAGDLGVALSANGDEQGSMGVDAGDYDRDGRLDLIVTNYQKQLNALYHWERDDLYLDLAMARGLGETSLPMVKWGTKFFDFDHDAWLDLFVANGHLEEHIHEYDQSSSYRQQSQLFRNQGGGVFKEVTGTAGPGLDQRFSSRGAAFGDLDNDGDIDIVVANSRERPSLLYNEGGNRGSWVMLELRGRRNRFAVGAFVRVTAGGITQVAEVHAGASYVSQNDLRLHFGLAGAEAVDRVEVQWQEGLRETFEKLPARKVHRLVEGTGQAAAKLWFSPE